MVPEVVEVVVPEVVESVAPDVVDSVVVQVHSTQLQVSLGHDSVVVVGEVVEVDGKTLG